jgi:diguanylate cyclase (GGDEF)-like protein/excisionase family DNA binding protein
MTRGLTPGSIDDHEGQWLTVGQAARLLGVSAQTVRKWTDAGTLTTVRTQGGHRRYDRALVEQLVAGGRPAGAASGSDEAKSLAEGEFARELADIVFALVDEQDPRAVLDTSCRKLMDTMHCTGAAISAYDAPTASVVALAERGTSSAVDNERYALPDYPITAAVIRERRIVFVDRNDPDADRSEVALLDEYGDQTLLMAPLVFRDEVVGLVELTDAVAGRRYTKAELRDFERVCAEVALKVQIARALESLHRQRVAAERKSAEFELLVRSAQAMGSSLDLRVTLDSVTRNITETLGVAWSDFYEWFPDEQIIEVTAYYQIPEVPVWEDWVGTRMGAENMRDWSATIDELKPSLAYRDDPDITDAERELMDEYDEKATLTVPIVFQGEVLGMLDVGESRWNRRYTDEEVKLLTTIANQAAGAIHNARLYQLIETQAITDGLTGLFNHKRLDENLVEEIARAKRYETNLSVIMMDIDDFKHFNDTYGHPQGDGLLREIAGILRKAVRDKIDFVARYGGEEFCILLPNTPQTELNEEIANDRSALEQSAMVLAERIRETVATTPFEGYPGRREVAVTLSLGVASFPIDGVTGAEVVANADKALYLAKRGGKNQVVLYSLGPAL